MHNAGEVAFALAVFDGLAFVKLLLATGYADDELGQAAIVDEQAQGHDGIAHLLAVFLQLDYLLAVE